MSSITRRELLGGAALLGAAACTAPQIDRRPNILLVYSDDQSYPHASALGDPVVRTPAFDRVAAEGVVLTQSYTACPSCTPSRSALLTGRHIWRIGEAGVLYGTLSPEYPLFTHLLEDAGYHTGFVGKPWAPGDWRSGGLQRHPIGTEYSQRLEADPPAGIDTRDYAANFADFLAARPDGAPFLFFFGATEPHRDYEPGIGMRSGLDPSEVQVPPYLPDAPEVRSELLDYYYEIEHYDRHLGRMLDTLERTGELDNTLVVVTSDNGMPFSRTKATLYDGGTRMPTAVRWGDRVPGGRQVDDFVSHIDWLPRSWMPPAWGRSPATTAAASCPCSNRKGRASWILRETTRSPRWSGTRGAVPRGPRIRCGRSARMTTCTSATSSRTAGRRAARNSSLPTRRRTAIWTTGRSRISCSARRRVATSRKRSSRASGNDRPKSSTTAARIPTR